MNKLDIKSAETNCPVCAPSPITEIELYDPAQLARVIAEAMGGWFDDVTTSAEETKRLACLAGIRDSPLGSRRTLLYGSPELITRLDRLGQSAPNFGAVVGLYRREALASIQCGAPMTMPPVILLGPPGGGKTHFARALAATLGTPFAETAMNLCDDVAELVGNSLSWKNARMGLVAKTLLAEKCASPVLLIDEIEKAPKRAPDETPAAIWHTFFERENARSFRDMFLGLPLRADHVFWLCTANSLAGLPPAVIDRALIITIAPAGFAERRALAIRIFEKFVAERSGLKSASEPALSFLAEHSPRTMIKLLIVAHGFAAERGSTALGPEDLAKAQRLMAPVGNKQKIGFV